MSSYDTEFGYELDGEFDGELDEFEFESEGEEFLGNVANALFGEVEGELSEEQEEEWAAELLEITDEAELEEFLGKIFRKVGRMVRSPIGRALGGVLKKVAKTALPVVGGAIGSLVAPGAGTALGTKLGAMATRLFELEYEAGTMDEQELEFEVAKRYVRLASTAARHAARAPRGADPRAVAKAAVVKAARTHARPLAKVVARTPATVLVRSGPTYTSYDPYRSVGLGTGARAGRWVRRGRRIILYGA